MQKKTIGLIILLTAIILFSGVIYIFFISDYLSRPNVDNAVTNGSQTNDQATPKVINADDKNQTNAGQNTEIKQIEINMGDDPTGQAQVPAQTGKKDLARIAMSFAERFGSYSNQSSFSNINSLKIFMSTKMKTWAEGYMRDKKEGNYDTAIYYGITTKAVSSELQEYDDDFGTATILIMTRRREATGTMNNYASVFNQNVLIGFVKEDGAWKVDSALWQ